MTFSEESTTHPQPIEPQEAQRPKLSKLWTLLFVLFLLWSSRETILTTYGGFFVVDDATKGADAVLILGGDVIVRLSHALDLVEQGYAERLLVTTPKSRMGDYKAYEMTDLRFARMVIGNQGLEIPVQALPSRDESTTSTLDEAYDLRAYAEAEGLEHIVATTGACSTRRARFALRQAFRDSDILVEISAAENEIFNASNWWRSDLGIQCYILEPAKFTAYLLHYADPDWMRND